jgi:hypothetical protein
MTAIKDGKGVIITVGLLLAALLALAACGASQVEDGLPLAEDRPTLFFFYTDG